MVTEFLMGFDTKEQAEAYARTIVGCWTITIFQSKISGKWIVNQF